MIYCRHISSRKYENMSRLTAVKHFKRCSPETRQYRRRRSSSHHYIHLRASCISTTTGDKNITNSIYIHKHSGVIGFGYIGLATRNARALCANIRPTYPPKATWILSKVTFVICSDLQAMFSKCQSQVFPCQERLLLLLIIQGILWGRVLQHYTDHYTSPLL